MCAGFAPFSSALFPGKCSKPLFSVPWSLPARRSSAFPTRVHRRAGHADGVWAHCRRVDVRHHRRDSLSGDGRARKGAGLCRALIVIQQIEGTLIYPRVMGKRVPFPPCGCWSPLRWAAACRRMGQAAVRAGFCHRLSVAPLRSIPAGRGKALQRTHNARPSSAKHISPYR